MDIDAVILDMDGLMLDTELLYKKAWQAAASQLGFVLDDSFYFRLIGRTNAAGEIALAERFGPDFPVPSFRERWAGVARGSRSERDSFEAGTHGIAGTSGSAPRARGHRYVQLRHYRAFARSR